MNYTEETTLVESISKLENYLPHIGINRVKQEIIDGLKSFPKFISPKYFYDHKGSELFEEITNLDEYYPTRTEKSILSTIVKKLNINFSNLSIIELGSGDSSKIRLLLEQIPSKYLSTINYFPFDISQSAIEKASQDLQVLFPTINTTGIVADFIHQIDKVPKVKNRLFCFFGSTIGNLTKNEIHEFMISLGAEMSDGDSLLLGMDLVKDISILEKAYNDAKGITAEFNKNVLSVINKLANLNFNESDFEHVVFYNREKNRIEMHLKALDNLEVLSSNGNEIIRFKKGETIHTENSHKFNLDDIKTVGSWAGLNVEQVITDNNKWFSLVHYKMK